MRKVIVLKEGRCKEEVSDSTGWNNHQCSRKAVEDGYCKQHNPERVEARNKARNEEWDREWAANRHRDKIRSKEREALELVKRIARGVDYPTERAKDFIRELDAVINTPQERS